MESTFYYFPGQTPENTKISDRSHALHVTSDAWKRITGHLDRRKLIQEAIDKEVAYKKALKDGSYAMTCTWENSVENVRRRKEEERIRKIAELEDNKFKGYYKVRVEQEAKRKQFEEQVQKRLFTSTGYPRQINYGLLTCEVIRDRELQLELKKRLAEDEENMIVEEKKKIDEGAVQEKLENAEKAKKIFEKNVKWAKELQLTIEARKEHEALVKLQNLEREALDNIEAAKEMQEVEEATKAEKLRRIKEVRNEKKKYMEEKNAITGKRAKEDRELDEVIHVFRTTKEKMNCFIKKRERMFRETFKKRSELLAEKLGEFHGNREERYNFTEKDPYGERAMALAEKKESLKQQLLQEVLEGRKKQVEEIDKLRAQEQDVKKYEMLNRYKTNEVLKQYEEEQRAKAREAVLKYKAELEKQIEEDRMQKVEKEDELPYGKDYEEEDRKFFEYANDTLQLAKDKGYNTYPIESVIKAYKKENVLDLKENKRLCEDTYAKKPVDLVQVKKIFKNKNPCKCCRNE